MVSFVSTIVCEIIKFLTFQVKKNLSFNELDLLEVHEYPSEKILIREQPKVSDHRLSLVITPVSFLSLRSVVIIVLL